MKPPKVMIATDGSDAAVEAATRAVALLHPDARIELVTVVDARHDPMEDAGGLEGPVMTDEEADEEWTESVTEGQAALDRTAAALHVPSERQLVPTDTTVDRALRDLVAEERPDLLVLGSNQPSWFARFLHGSMEERLLHHVTCPLLIVGHHRTDDPPADFERTIR